MIDLPFLDGENTPALQFLITILENPWMLLAIIMWHLIWDGIALWIAAREEDKPWFIAILVLNTLGVLEILYIYYFSKKRREAREQTKTEKAAQ